MKARFNKFDVALRTRLKMSTLRVNSSCYTLLRHSKSLLLCSNKIISNTSVERIKNGAYMPGEATKIKVDAKSNFAKIFQNLSNTLHLLQLQHMHKIYKFYLFTFIFFQLYFPF